MVAPLSSVPAALLSFSVRPAPKCIKFPQHQGSRDPFPMNSLSNNKGLSQPLPAWVVPCIPRKRRPAAVPSKSVQGASGRGNTQDFPYSVASHARWDNPPRRRLKTGSNCLLTESVLRDADACRFPGPEQYPSYQIPSHWFQDVPGGIPRTGCPATIPHGPDTTEWSFWIGRVVLALESPNSLRILGRRFNRASSGHGRL